MIPYGFRLRECSFGYSIYYICTNLNCSLQSVKSRAGGCFCTMNKIPLSGAIFREGGIHLFIRQKRTALRTFYPIQHIELKLILLFKPGLVLTQTDKKIRFNLVYLGKTGERENNMNKNEQAEMLRPEDRPIPMRQQFAYALNELASNPVYTITLSFLTFFYTDVLGLNAAVVGIVILISKLFDGISDLWAGNLIDHTHTKNGSARPWILRSAVPMGLCYVLLFTVPDIGNAGKIIYIFVTYNFAMTFAFTIMNCAINALPVYMSNHSASRASAYSIRMIFAGIVQLVVSMIILPMVDAMGGGQKGWILMSAVLGTISFLICVAVYFGTKENVSYPAEKGSGEKLDVPFKTAIASVLHNKYWFIVLGMILIIVFHQVATLTVGVYYAKYILFDEKLAGNLVLYHHLGSAVGMLAMPFILKKNISKRNAVLTATLVMIAGSVIAVIKCSGVYLVISLALRGCGFGIVNSLYYGMLADSVEYGEWKTGIRAAAVTTSASSVGQKLGAGIGTAIMGLVLNAAGYNGLLSAQPEAALKAINIIFVHVPLVLYIVLLVLVLSYRLDKELPGIKQDLAERHSKGAEI